MQKIKIVLSGLAVVVMSIFGIVRPVSAAVNCPPGSLRSGSAETLADCNVAENEDTLMATVFNVIRVVLGVLGLVAAIVIIVGGVQYMTAAGDAAKVAKAQNTILFAVVGLIIAILAFVIVNFVIANIIK